MSGSEATAAEGCCVCGRSELPNSSNDVAGQLGHPPIYEAVTWRCQACGRLVCRECVFTVSTAVQLQGPAASLHRGVGQLVGTGMVVPIPEIPTRTLCTEPGCVQARSRSQGDS